MTPMRAIAPAKINLSLRVRSKDASGMHPLVSLAQSIGWHDILTLRESDEDELSVAGAAVPTDGANLVWKAVNALRAHHGTERPASFALTKRVPASAGLGGGSADAAAALRLYAAYCELPIDDLDGIAAQVGSDVMFCLHGGLRWMEGYGERLSGPLDDADDYWVVVAVPPFELDTPGVYQAWDHLGEPEGVAVTGSAVPPSLRAHGPLVNDLLPAAVHREPELGDWRAELGALWDRPVLMSGSGPSLFAFFADESEAGDGLAAVPGQARGSFAAPPLGYGALVDDQ